MVGSYVKISLRHIFRHKGFSLLNIAGLAVGMACAMAMYLHVAFELSYDRHWPNAGRIARLSAELTRDGRTIASADVPALPPLEAEFPEVEASARLFTYSWKEAALVTYGDKSLFEERFFLADPSIFDVFAIPLLEGGGRPAFEEPASIVISESAARRLFDRESPVGKTVTVKNLGRADFVVRGVFRDFPANSHFRADFIAPLAAGERLFWADFSKRNNFYHYLLLREGRAGASLRSLESKLPAFLTKHRDAEAAVFTLKIQRLTDIHLRSQLNGEIEANGDVRTVVLLGVLAVIILAGACINFVNLATARAESRAKEVGLRKVVGASRAQVIRQFLAESFVTALAALPAAFFLLAALLPALNVVLQTELSLAAAGTGTIVFGFGLIVLLVGIAAGLYPAFVLSAFDPVRVLKSRTQTGGRKSIGRGLLVVVQSAATIVLLAGAFVVFFQMRFIRSESMGRSGGPVVVLPLKDYESVQGYPLLRAALMQSPDILGVTASESLPSDVGRRHDAWHEGAAAGEEAPILWNAVDFGFLETYDLTLADGRAFSPEIGSDEARAYIINEAAARAFGWKNPVGMRFSLSNKDLARSMFEEGRIIGVVKDFHAQSLRKTIEPVVLSIQKGMFRHVGVKIRPGRIRPALDFMADRWKSIYPGRPFNYDFFDETVARMYRAERRTGRVFGYASVLSLVISGLGLFGLASYAAARRTREIGIRKTLGATTADILRLLSRDFSRLFLVANAIAWPVAFVLMNGWLRGFAYRIAFGPRIFILAGAAAFALLAVSVGSQALRAALADPVDSLRYD
jgi:putative ABC transport system permease protein